MLGRALGKSLVRELGLSSQILPEAYIYEQLLELRRCGRGGDAEA